MAHSFLIRDSTFQVLEDMGEVSPQQNMCFSQELHSPSLLAAIAKSQQSLAGDVMGLIREEIHYSPEKVSPDLVLRVLDQGGWNIKLE